ncbi:MAG: hypothetical protein RJA61_742 [Candidatus Parcubacteria bacterium]|jgi:alanine racemase
MQTSRVEGVRTWIEIDTKAIRHNYDQFRSLISKETKLCGVVKSNAYGHGLVDFSRELEKLGVDMLAVDSVSEALRLRKEGIKTPLVVLGYTLPEKIKEAVQNDIAITISQFETLREIEGIDLEKKLKIHIKVDTGMHRQGFLEEDSSCFIDTLKKLSLKIDVVGLFSHFASANEPEQILFTEIQIKRLLAWKDVLNRVGFSFILHIGATSGVLGSKHAHFDMVRVGAGLYGIWPSLQVKEKAETQISLKSVLTWKAIISEIKKIPQGERVGYGLTEELVRDSIIAIIPIGYWHGFPRSLSGKGEVLVGGVRARVLGRVSMDMIVVDVTGIPKVKVLDEVVLIGKQGNEEVTPQEFALKVGSSAYEVVTRLNPLIKKIYQ